MTLASIAMRGKPALGQVSFPMPGRIQGVDPADMAAIATLRDVWADKYPGNVRRGKYYDAREAYRDFGLSVPPSIASRIRPMVGWPAKAVRTLADLSAFEGFRTSQDTPDMLTRIARASRLETTMGQAITSCYIHSCAFLTVTRDSTGQSVVTPRSAAWSAATWDGAAGQVGSALTILSTDDQGQVDAFNVFLPHALYQVRRAGSTWTAVRSENPLGRPTVAAIAYDPQLDRPFGRSRITRPLMALTDIAIRTMARMEATAEFYSAPKLWFLGANPDTFDKDLWSSLVSVINAVSRDENDETPTLQQVQQASMQPHSDMLRTIAMLVASETSLPVNDLGITLDNPGSAEAMAAAERKLSREADRQNRLYTTALRDAMGMALQLAGTSVDPEVIQPVWAPTREVSDAARADYYAKIAAVNTDFADSDVGLAKAGLTLADITSLRAHQQRLRAQARIDQLRQQTQQPAQPAQQTREEAGDGNEPESEQPARDAGTQDAAGTGAAGIRG